MSFQQYQLYDEQTASPEDRIAWKLCQIIDDDAPMRWTRFRFVTACICADPTLVEDLAVLRKRLQTQAR